LFLIKLRGSGNTGGVELQFCKRRLKNCSDKNSTDVIFITPPYVYFSTDFIIGQNFIFLTARMENSGENIKN
jgi:16S rRNA G966 N2-methylase RsmD